jgi:hypothetical protein
MVQVAQLDQVVALQGQLDQRGLLVQADLLVLVRVDRLVLLVVQARRDQVARVVLMARVARVDPLAQVQVVQRDRVARVVRVAQQAQVRVARQGQAARVDPLVLAQVGLLDLMV